VVRMTLHGESVSQVFDEVSAPAKGFIRLLLDPDPKLRMRCNEALQHPWLQARPRVGRCQGSVTGALSLCLLTALFARRASRTRR
jgi:hypothetical protein